MRLPLLLSVPHAGWWVPPEVEPLCALTPQDILEDGDEGAREIYALEAEVTAFATTEVARAIIDLNRSEDDRSKDGVVKTHTCWDVPVYNRFPDEDHIEDLLRKYYRPHHLRLKNLAKKARLGIDCHTMAANAPPVAPDAGSHRPRVCLSNADGTCPDPWFESLAECLGRAFSTDVSRNEPFRGGYIIRTHSTELPWVQLELSREHFLPNDRKRAAVLRAVTEWCRRIL